MLEKKKIAAVIAEFVGTAVLTVLILTVQRSTIGVPFFVATAAGLVVIVMVFALLDVSGANFNPALTIALWTARKISTVRSLFYIGAQMLGGWSAYYLYTFLVNSKLQPIGGHYTSRTLVAESFGAAVFAFVWASGMFQKLSKPTRASIAGLGYMIGMIGASAAAIGLINPSVALGVRAWVWGTYVLGPVLGAIIGVNLYGLLFSSASDSKVETSLVEVNNYDTNLTVINEIAPAPTKSKSNSSKTKTTAKKKTNSKKTTKK